jgi:DNA-binding CsgD family transcriptional regulator
VIAIRGRTAGSRTSVWIWALFVTVKSVAWHLGNVYRKLDIGGRGQLADAL